jgi:hypothetical protein
MQVAIFIIFVLRQNKQLTLLSYQATVLLLFGSSSKAKVNTKKGRNATNRKYQKIAVTRKALRSTKMLQLRGDPKMKLSSAQKMKTNEKTDSLACLQHAQQNTHYSSN